MLLFCKKNNVEVSAYSVLTPTFIIEPLYEVRPYVRASFLTAVVAMLIFPWEMNFFGFRGGGMSEIAFSFNNADKIMLKTGAVNS